MQICPACNTEAPTDICSKCSFSRTAQDFDDKSELAERVKGLMAGTHWAEGCALVEFAHNHMLTSDPPWTHSQTADLLGVSRQTVDNWLAIAKSIRDHPEIKPGPNFHQSRKKLKNILKARESNSAQVQYEAELESYIEKNYQSLKFFGEGEPVDLELKESQYRLGKDKIDLLFCERPNRDTWYVFELKGGMADDKTVGQLIRYAGGIMQNPSCKQVKGAIVAHEFEPSLASSAHFLLPKFRFYRYNRSSDGSYSFSFQVPFNGCLVPIEALAALAPGPAEG